jgi:HEAT repeat protein
MIARLKYSLALVIVFSVGQYATSGKELTKADIPPGLSSELKLLIEDTFSKDFKTCLNAVDRLLAMGEKAAPAMPFILRLLEDRDWHLAEVVTRRVGDALSKYPALRKVPGVVQALTRFSENPDVNRRSDAATLLAQSRIPGAFELLVKMLKDPEHGVRESAILALGDLGDRRAEPILVEIVYSCDRHADEYLSEGCVAEVAMGKVGGKLTFYVLRNALRDWFTRKRFVSTDMREGAVGGLGLLRDREAIKLLEWILKDKLNIPYRVRAEVPAALASIEGRDAVPLLKQMAIDKEEQPIVREAAGIVLADVLKGEIDNIEVVEVIGSSFDDVEEVLLLIAKHGKTEAIRKAAQGYLRRYQK